MNPDGRYFCLDTYNPGEEIVSRKNTQFSDISVETGIGYITELVTKYARGAKVADVPSSGLQTEKLPTDKSLKGQTLGGRYILEVPKQIEPIPPKVLDTAKANAVGICNIYGYIKL